VTRVYVIEPNDLGPGEIASWHQMQKATPSLADPFLAPEYAMVVGRFRPRSKVGVLMDGQCVGGFFPFEARRLGVGVPISGWLSTCQGVIHEPGMQWDTSELLRKCGLSAWRFDNLLADQAAFRPYHANIAPTPVIDLTGGFDNYYAQLRERAPRFCRETERKARKLGREVGELRLELDSPNPSLLSTLMCWKSDQYRRTDHVDRFNLPWLSDLLHALLATRSDHLSGMLSVLYAGDEPVSIQFGLRAAGTLVGWFIGYDQRFRKYSPGLLQIRMMTEALWTVDIDTVCMGRGAKYSARIFKNFDFPVAEGMATDRSVLGAAHRVRNGINRRALHAVRERSALHRAADQVLRRTGASSRFYGKVLTPTRSITPPRRPSPGLPARLRWQPDTIRNQQPDVTYVVYQKLYQGCS
jgi:CelD/BcsL family acetyltransferase involved in cellulose biosynthesis